MAAQKCTKNLLAEIFDDFECLLTQNPTNQDWQLSWFFQTIWKIVRKFKNMELYGIISVWKWFQNLLWVNSTKWLKNWILWFLELYFYSHIQQRWYLAGGKSFWSVIRRKKSEHFKIMKKSIIAAQKCKSILLLVALKDFRSSANPNEKISMSKLSLLQVILQKMQE